MELGGLEMLEILPKETKENQPKVYVVGVGGAGNNAVNRISARLKYPVSYFAVNTDEAVLNDSQVENRIQIGKKLTKGFGAGGNAEIGRSSAEESDEDIFAALKDANMVILTCGMGGGTGTGATPIIAQMCKEAGILTMAVVTTPFSFESRPRYSQAEAGIEQLRQYVDMLVTVRNDRLIEMSEKPITVETAFQEADEVLAHVIEGITSIIFKKGVVNLDFNDLSATLRDSGDGYLGISRGTDDENLMEIFKRAIESPLMEGDYSSANRILINTSGNVDVRQLHEAIQYIRGMVSENANVMWGTVDNKEADNEIVITFIATGIKMWDHQIEPIIRPSKLTNQTGNNAFNVSTSGKKDFSETIRSFGDGIRDKSSPITQKRDLKVPLDKIRARSVEIQADSGGSMTRGYTRTQTVANLRQPAGADQRHSTNQGQQTVAVSRQIVDSGQPVGVNLRQSVEQGRATAAPVIPDFLQNKKQGR